MRSSLGVPRSSVRDRASHNTDLLGAIQRAGVLGITAKQLGTVTGLPPGTISDHLHDLSRRSSISKVGRGLWVLKRHETMNSPVQTTYLSEFERRFGLQMGGFEGPIKFQPNERLPVHRWWPYVQGFSAEFVEGVAKRARIGPGRTVLDPFCGSGTVPIVARSMGASGIGIDMMPIAALVADAKGEWDVKPELLAKVANDVVARRRSPGIPPPFLTETRRHYREEVLVNLLRLKENLWALPKGGVRNLLQLAFASILIDSSQLKRSPCLGYAKGKRVPAEAPVRLFLEAVYRIGDDLRSLQTRGEAWGPRSRIVCGNAGLVALEEGSVDLAVTSPPYVNGMDYVMNYKIDLAWMDLVGSYAELAQLRSSMVACDNIPRGVAARHEPSDTVLSDPWLASLTKQIDANVRAKGAYRRHDMGSVVTKYFDDLLPVLRNVYRSLKPGAQFVVVNGDSLMAGVYIPGDMIFASLAAQVGFEVKALDLARTRRSGQRRGYLLRETILTLQKPRSGGQEGPS